MTLWNKIVKETEEIKTSMECNQCKLRHVCNTCAAAAIAECGDSEGVSKYLCEYTQDIAMREQHKADTIHSFKRALSQKEFKVYFQPKIHGKDQTLAGAEALVRWQWDARTIWYPDVFLPILEEYDNTDNEDGSSDTGNDDQTSGDESGDDSGDDSSDQIDSPVDDTTADNTDGSLDGTEEDNYDNAEQITY